MPYDDVINWPQSIDTFPTLRDNQSPSVGADQILYAEHYNKIANFIRRAQAQWTNTTVATGDGTIKTLYYPSDSGLMGFVIPLNVVARISCPWAYDARSYPNGFPTTNIPGNVLPFEFVLTQDTGYVLNWQTGSYHMAYQNQSASSINSMLKGASYLSYPRFQVSIYKNDFIASSPAANDPFTHYCNQNFIVNSWGLVGEQLLIIRGTVVDMSGTSPTGGQEIWDMYSNWSLACVFQGVRSG